MDDKPGIRDIDDLAGIVSRLHEKRRGYLLAYYPAERPEWPYVATVYGRDQWGEPGWYTGDGATMEEALIRANDKAESPQVPF